MQTRPNIIYILADDLGYGDLGCYGQTLIQTPNIDRLAAEGIRFTDHYAGSPLCAPSRCVLMTGLHTGHCYVRGNRALPFEGNMPIPAESATIPGLLKEVGYATGAMGKWGLGFPGSEGDPVKQGFDLFFGYNCQRQAHSYYPPHLWRNTEKVMLPGNADGRQEQYSHDLLAEEALQFIRDHAGAPFFLYLPFTLPHTRFEIPELGIYGDMPWTADQKAQAAMISRLDRDVGRIVAQVQELGLDGDTLVMFASDNGAHGSGGTVPHFNASGPLRARKGAVYEGGIRVPLIARWPGRIAPGTVTSHVSGFQDMLPTFLELAGAVLSVCTDGISMVPALLNEGSQAQHEFLYWELKRDVAVRRGRWKAVLPGGLGDRDARVELYDLETDIGEQRDVAAAHLELAAELHDIATRAHQHSPWFDITYDAEGMPCPLAGRAI